MPTREEILADLEGYTPATKPTRQDVLKELGASVGEKDARPSRAIVQQEVGIKAEQPSAMEQFAYGFESGENLGSDIYDLVAITWGNGEGVATPDKWEEMSWEERRVAYHTSEENRLREKYKNVIEAGLEDSAWAKAGGGIKMFADPTMLLPGGAVLKAGKGAHTLTKAGKVVDYAKRAKTAAGAGFGYGYAASSAHQLSAEGTIDHAEATAVAATTAIASPALMSASRAAGKKIATISNDRAAARRNLAPKDMTKTDAKRIYSAMEDDIVEGMTAVEPSPLFPEDVLKLPTEERILKVSEIVSNRYGKAFGDEATWLRKAGQERPPGFDLNSVTTGRILENNGPSEMWWDRIKEGTGVIDHALGSMDTRLRNVSPRMYGMLTRHQQQSAQNIHNFELQIDAFDTQLKKVMGKENAQKVWRRMFEGEWDTAATIVGTSDDKLMDDLLNLKARMKVFEGEAKYFNIIGTKENPIIKNYFPHRVKNLRGLMRALGTKDKGAIEAAWKAAQDKAVAKGEKLTQYDRAMIAEKVIRDRGVRVGKRTDAQFKRSIKKVGAAEKRLGIDLMKYYHDPKDGLILYARDMMSEIDMRKFLGRIDLKEDLSGVARRAKEKTMDDSLSKFLSTEIQTGKLNPWQQAEVTDILQAIFGPGRRHPTKLLSTVKSGAYTSLLANPIAALQQAGDAGIAMAMHGPVNTTRGMMRNAAAKLGISDRLVKKVEEQGVAAPAYDVQTGGAHHILTEGLRWMGFSSMDRTMKNTTKSAAFRSTVKQVQTEKGRKQLYAEYAKYWGVEDASQLVSDFRAYKSTKKVTPLMEEYSVLKLGELQPLMSAALPEWYARHPNGRILYTLATWSLRLVDVARREGYNTMVNGLRNKDIGMTTQGMANLTKLGFYLGITGAGINYIQGAMTGKDMKPEDFPHEFWEEALGAFFLGERFVDDVEREGVGSGVTSNIPASALINRADLAGAVVTEPLFAESGERWEAFKEGSVDTARALPGIGPFARAATTLLGGGGWNDEKWNKWMEGQRKKRREEESGGLPLPELPSRKTPTLTLPQISNKLGGN